MGRGVTVLEGYGELVAEGVGVENSRSETDIVDTGTEVRNCMEFPAATGTAASGDDNVRGAGVVKITGTSTETQQQQTVVTQSDSRVNSEFPILRILNFLGLEQRRCYPRFLEKIQ